MMHVHKKPFPQRLPHELEVESHQTEKSHTNLIPISSTGDYGFSYFRCALIHYLYPMLNVFTSMLNVVFQHRLNAQVIQLILAICG